MPKLTFISKNTKNKGIVINDKELLSLYFYGIEVVNRQGTSINPTFLEFYIKSAQDEIEKYLQIKLLKQRVLERSDYYRNEFRNSGFIKTKYPVREPLGLVGKLGEQTIVRYPKHWLTFNKVNDLPTSRQIVMVPNARVSETQLQESIYGHNLLPTLGFANWDQVASYWEVEYVTGFDFDDMPFDLFNLVGKSASLGLFNILGDIALGQAGLASYSIGIDGLSQSVSTTSSATNAAYGARIINYQKEIKDTLEKMRGIYKGINFTAI